MRALWDASWSSVGFLLQSRTVRHHYCFQWCAGDGSFDPWLLFVRFLWCSVCRVFVICDCLAVCIVELCSWNESSCQLRHVSISPVDGSSPIFEHLKVCSNVRQICPIHTCAWLFLSRVHRCASPERWAVVSTSHTYFCQVEQPTRHAQETTFLVHSSTQNETRLADIRHQHLLSGHASEDVPCLLKLSQF